MKLQQQQMNTFLSDSKVHKTARNITVFDRAVRHNKTERKKEKKSVNVHTFNFHRQKI